MRSKRTEQEELVYQLRQLNAQAAPGVVIFKVGFYLAIFFIGVGLLAALCMPGGFFK